MLALTFAAGAPAPSTAADADVVEDGFDAAEEVDVAADPHAVTSRSTPHPASAIDRECVAFLTVERKAGNSFGSIVLNLNSR